MMLSPKDPLKGGGGRESYGYAHALAAAQAGYEVHLFHPAPGSGVRVTDFGFKHAVGTPVRPISYHLSIAHAPVYTRALVAFARTLDRGQPVILHSFGGVLATIADSAARRLARLGVATRLVGSAVTTLAHEHEALLVGMRARGVQSPYNLARYGARAAWVRTSGTRVERHGLRSCQRVLVNYRSVRDIVAAAYGEELPFRRIPYASALAFTRPADGPLPPLPPAVARLAPRDAPLLLTTSRHDPRKGLDLLLGVLRELADEGVAFRACMVGPGQLLEPDRRLVRQLHLEDRVSVPGRVDDVVAYLRHADLLVLPSLEEGSGSVSLLEAMQFGVAAVASACDGIPEDVADGEQALLVAPGDAVALRTAVRRLLGDASLRARLGAAARERHAERFAPAPFVRALAEVYAELGVHGAPQVTARSRAAAGASTTLW